jgi:hypothetical protein
LLLTLVCSSCETGPQVKAVVPPIPQPAPPPAPVLEPQTVAQLPAPQPVPPDSVPPRPRVEYQPPVVEAPPETEPPPEDNKAIQPPVKTARAPKRQTGDQPEVTPTPAPPPPPVEEQPPAPVPQTLSAAEDHSISKDQVSTTLSEVQQILKEITSKPESAATSSTVRRIRSFVKLSEQSIARNDLRQADILAQRAKALANDLARPK